MIFPSSKTFFLLAAAFAVVRAEDDPNNERGFGGLRAPTTTAPAPTDAPTQSPVATPDDKTTVDDTSNVKGDPHFQTFGEEKYDYHGECDLVLLKNPLFKEVGMEVHIRTKITDWWSSVEAAAVKLGDEVLEVNAGNLDQWLWINGNANEEMEDNKYYTSQVNGMHVRYQRKGVNREANIYLEGRPERAVVAPNKCKLPEFRTKQEMKSMIRKRRLAGGLSEDAIERACAHVPEGEREDCIYDVTATQDVGMASVF
ncbi:expressed unknown protein [Seminavis robusta]|uniref:VWFD domain-containing protein n=1 Tax=Seminavis robusta TaxID=568900 RepID=A0A9N8H3A4_9STRA|nr:expressed unknown protein [Seminavis robusta]|eukprot:Sro34_g022000.1 n/a (256) ;mRNA; f:81389-82375